MSELATVVPPFVIVAVAAALVTVLPRRIGHAIGVLSLVAVAAISLAAPAGTYYQTSLFELFDVALFSVNGFSSAFGFAFAALGGAAVLYAYSSDAPRMVTAFALTYVASTMGVLFAGDWLTLLFFSELMAVTSTLLVWHYGGAAVRAGFRYALAHGISGSLLLLAVTWHFVETGTFLFPESGVASIASGMPLYLAIVGMGINCGFVGLHFWLPDTYPRPHFAASVFLSVFTTKTSAYVMYRILPLGDSLTLAVAYMGGVMAVYGVVFALLQHDMRALLTYHIQAQVGYMIAGMGLGLYLGGNALELGAGGALAHVFNNILFKALLFMAVGVIIYRTGIEDLYELGGLWREMPLTAAGFGLGALSITAIPGFNGFISKGMILDAADPHYYGSAATEPIYWLLWLGAIGTLLSFIKLGYYAFFHGEWDGPKLADAKPGHTVAMLSIGGLCLLFGVWWEGLLSVLPWPLVAEEAYHLHPYSASHLQSQAILIGISAVAFAVIKKPLSKLGHVPDPAKAVSWLAFYGGKAGVVGVTELYGVVDRAGIRLVRTCYWVGSNPALAAARVARRLPRTVRPTLGHDEPPTDGGTVSRHYLRADIRTTILVLTAVLTIVLLLAL
ncbi:MAG: Na(+)/H(+) antiporter subunit D [Haloarculaceae archaeon]